MMGRHNRDQGQLFYSFCLDEAVPDDHRAREIAAVLATGAGKFVFMDWLQWKLPFIIAAIVSLSVGLGFINEFRSEAAVAALHANIRHQALVWRDARQQHGEAEMRDHH